MNPITKELLEKYDIHEGNEEVYYMKEFPKAMFAMWPLNNGDWIYTYINPETGLNASAQIKTEDELITALKFSKLI